MGTVGARRFHVALNGATSGSLFLSNLDIFAAAGNSMNKAVVRSFAGVNLLTPVNTLLAPAGSFGLPVALRQGSGALRVTFLRRKSSRYPGISYAAEFSDSMNPGSWGENPNAVIAVESVDALFERVSVTDHLMTSSRRFARVRIKVL